MPESHAQNEAPTKRAPSIIERWACKIAICRNHGQLCYWAISDSVDDHLPITSVGMQYWLAAIARKECTDEVPPPQLVEQWQLSNLRVLQRREAQREHREERREQREERREQRAERKQAARKSSAQNEKSPASALKSSNHSSSVKSKIVRWT